jgi:hypothetical protein
MPYPPEPAPSAKAPWKPFHNSKPWKVDTFRTVPNKIRPPPPPFLKWLVNPAVPLDGKPTR